MSGKKQYNFGNRDSILEWLRENKGNFTLTKGVNGGVVLTNNLTRKADYQMTNVLNDNFWPDELTRFLPIEKVTGLSQIQPYKGRTFGYDDAQQSGEQRGPGAGDAAAAAANNSGGRRSRKSKKSRKSYKKSYKKSRKSRRYRR